MRALSFFRAFKHSPAIIASVAFLNTKVPGAGTFIGSILSLGEMLVRRNDKNGGERGARRKRIPRPALTLFKNFQPQLC